LVVGNSYLRATGHTGSPFRLPASGFPLSLFPFAPLCTVLHNLHNAISTLTPSSKTTYHQKTRIKKKLSAHASPYADLRVPLSSFLVPPLLTPTPNPSKSLEICSSSHPIRACSA
jgi:hypothetical protein